MIEGQRTTDRDTTDYLIKLRDSLLAHKARGETLDDAIRGLSRAIRARMLKEKQA